MNKTMTNAYARYNNSKMDTIYKAYKKPSARKVRVWHHWMEACAMLNGRNMKVIGKNCNMFSLGFEYPDPKTGVLNFMYVTPTKEMTAEIPV